MIITFCGHRIFDKNEKEFGLYELLCNIIKENSVEFFIGGYGAFDDYALYTAIKYKEKHQKTKIYFITPYIDKGYTKLEYYKDKVDGIIYPELEKVPKKFAILKRNEWMIKRADVAIAYVKLSWGGAWNSLEYAKKLKKKIINLANQDYSKTKNYI